MIVNVAPLLKQPVGAHVDYRFSEDAIDPRGESAGLLDAHVTSIDAEIRAMHTDPGVYLDGEATAAVAQECSRCLRPVSSPVTARFAEQYYATIGVTSGEALDDAPRDAQTIGSDFRIDLTPLLREELILATPQAPLCRPDCEGLCPTCGEDLSEHPHAHEDVVDERWAGLRQLRDYHAERE